MSTHLSAVQAAGKAHVAVFAFQGPFDNPMALPVTPYMDGPRIIVTSTLAYIRKAELVRRDGRVAILAAGVHAKGTATVQADVSGDVFVARYLAQELEKYPPARSLVQIPDHRRSLSWYFGRAIISFPPTVVEERPGSDACTLTFIDGEGFLDIVPIREPDTDAPSFVIEALHGTIPDGPAVVLLHQESSNMSDLRQMTLRGSVRGNVFSVTSKRGSLAESDSATIDYGAREQRARMIMEQWQRAR